MKNKKLFLIIAALAIVFVSGVVSADSTGTNNATADRTVQLENPLGTGVGLCTIFKRIAGFMIWIAAPIVAGMIFYGAYQIMFAKGDPAAINKGKETILYSVVAYVIILMGWGVTSIIQEVLGSKVPIC